MERVLMVNEHMRHVDEIKQKTSYYIECLEVIVLNVIHTELSHANQD